MALIKSNKFKGKASKYLSRSKALRMFNLSLHAFRRLCIFKGIYPRDPGIARKKLKKKSRVKIYYYKKEIKSLINDPIITALRQQTIYAKKLTSLINKGMWLEAERLEANKPKITLDHVIKERYPTFELALNDLGDCLTLIYAISNLGGVKKIRQEDINECSILGIEFKNYIVKTKCISKVFVTIKGFYYQVNITNVPVTWSEPFKFVQSVPDSIDTRILNAFCQFYKVLLKFVLVHLYKTAGLVYPPKINVGEIELDSGLNEIIVEGTLSSIVNREIKEKNIPRQPKSANEERRKLEDQINLVTRANSGHKNGHQYDNGDIGDDENTLITFEPEISSNNKNESDWDEVNSGAEKLKTLFSECRIFLSRETPKSSLEFLIRACGGICGWDQYGKGNSHMDVNSTSITHQITDKNVKFISPKVEGRVYVQPQWVYDSINRAKLLNPDDYLPGNQLPPHLSPFVRYDDTTYVPDEAKKAMLDDGLVDPSELKEGTLDENCTVNSRDEEIESDNDEEYEMYKAEIEAESRGMKLSEYMKSEYYNKKSIDDNIQKDKNTGPDVKGINKNLKKKVNNGAKQDVELESKKLALSLLSKKKKKQYEILSRRKRRREREVDKLKTRKSMLSNKKINSFQHV